MASRIDISSSLEQQDYLDLLRSHIKAKVVLAQRGFILSPLTQDQLLLKRRCSNCNKG
jgi:hypothetical protein